ncbi:YciI family protein [Fusobacteria bacterium ZRK30]|nr:YciI family protein [Fusobacteria bacterium ZRK30]
MLIVNLTYKKSFEEVGKYLEEHMEFVKNEFSKGSFIASGKKVPRDGGIILSKIKDIKKLEKILNEDPFIINDVAKYEITEFTLSTTGEGFENLK